MAYTHLLESPNSFHTWTAISTVAAALRRQVWIDFGYFKIYPNLYVVLVSPPGRCRKNIAIKAGTSLLEDFTDIKISSESITREALIKALKQAETPTEDTKGKIYLHSSLTVISEELSVFLGQANFGLMALLTDLFDCPDFWEYRTKLSGTDTLYNIWLNILGGSTPTWLSGSIPLSAIGGGLTSRVIFVVEENVRQRTTFLELTNYELELKEMLINDLAEISVMRGNFTIDSEGRKYYDYWYQNDNPAIVNERIAGYFERRHIHVLKVASIISACQTSNMVITKEHIEVAVALLTMIEPKMIDAFGAIGRSTLTPDVDQVLKVVMSLKKISKSALISTVWRDVDPRLMDAILSALASMGKVRVTSEKGEPFVELVEEKK